MLAPAGAFARRAAPLAQFSVSIRDRARALLTLVTVYLRMILLILMRRPYKLTLLVTDGCNLRCQMCSIWTRKHAYLTLDELKQIWSAFAIKPCWVNISGGEPFLNRQLADMLAYFAALNRTLLVTITTNGQLDVSSLEPILKVSRKCAIFVSVSTDGDQPLHDAIRGRNGAFARASQTIERLRALSRRHPALSVGVSVTLSRSNLDQALPFLSRQIKILPVSVNLTQTSAYYGNDESHAFTALPKARLVSLLRLLQYLQPKFALDSVLKINYLERTIRFLEGKPSHAHCASIVSNVLITAQLDVVDCSLKFRPWDTRSGARAEKLQRIIDVIGDPGERHRALSRVIGQEHCERACYTPCENYVHLLADLLCPWRAPRLITCLLVRTFESWMFGRRALRLALANCDCSPSAAPVTLPIVACRSAE